MGGESAPVDAAPRRTVYAEISRGKPHTVLQLYDFPDATQHAPERQVTTTPLQQLFVLNSEWMLERAAALAERVAGIDEPAARVEALYRRALGRDPSARERDLALSFIARRAVEGRPWPELAQVLLGTNEFSYRD